MVPPCRFVFTVQTAASRYKVPAAPVRTLIDRLQLGSRLGRWRIIEPGELPRLEDGLRALGYRIPANLPSIAELEAQAIEASAVEASLEAASS
jgi:hypothetical protein